MFGSRYTSVKILRHFAKSSAVDASNPLVVLSQHATLDRVIIISAILIRFRSPPETPLIPATPPAMVFLVCSILNILRSVVMTSSLNAETDRPPARRRGVLVSRAKERI